MRVMLSRTPSPNPRAAQRLLTWNALFTSACALPMITFSEPLAAVLFRFEHAPVVLKGVGLGLTAHVALLLRARSLPVRSMPSWMQFFAWADLLWVVGTPWMVGLAAARLRANWLAPVFRR
jgi:hypothetical protein